VLLENKHPSSGHRYSDTAAAPDHNKQIVDQSSRMNVDAHSQRFTQVHFSVRFERRWCIEAGTATSDSTGMRPSLARVDTAAWDRMQHAHQARNVVRCILERLLQTLPVELQRIGGIKRFTTAREGALMRLGASV